MHEIEEMASGDEIPKPVWYPVKYSMVSPWDEKSGARLLVSFAKIDFHDDFTIQPDEIYLDR